MRGGSVSAVLPNHAPLAVEMLLILAPLLRTIVLLAPLVGLVATVVLAATKRATEIPPICVSRMREEANPTLAAGDRTACQFRMIAQDGIQRQLILTNKWASAVVLMPIRAKRKEFPDGYDKNARFSVKMLIVLCMSSSYSLDATAASRGARIFFMPDC
jgi:predicted cobalt transporter CbtA